MPVSNVTFTNGFAKMTNDLKRKFPYKYRTLHLAAGIFFIVIAIWLVVDEFSAADRLNTGIQSDHFIGTVLMIVSALYFISSALGTYIYVTNDGITIKAPFERIYSTWDNIERIGSVKVPKSIYSEPGIVFRQAPYSMHMVNVPFLPQLLDGRILLITSYMKDSDLKELEALAAAQIVGHSEKGKSLAG